MSDQKVFLYAEFQNSLPFDRFDWPNVNTAMKTVPGLRAKTWLSGVGTLSIGGFYEFDTLDNARAYAEGMLADFAKTAGAALSVKFFDGPAVAEASRLMNSPHFR